MTAAHEQLYRRTLHLLVAAGIPFVGLGTFALRCQCPQLPCRQVADCDVQLPPEPVVLTHLVQVLQAEGWRLTLWEQPVELPLQAAELSGKYYLRARQAGAVLDCAYENDFLPWPAFQADCHWHHGLPLLRLQTILQHKARAARPRDLALLHWWQQTIGPLP